MRSFTHKTHIYVVYDACADSHSTYRCVWLSQHICAVWHICADSHSTYSCLKQSAAWESQHIFAVWVGCSAILCVLRGSCILPSYGATRVVYSDILCELCISASYCASHVCCDILCRSCILPFSVSYVGCVFGHPMWVIYSDILLCGSCSLPPYLSYLSCVFRHPMWVVYSDILCVCGHSTFAFRVLSHPMCAMWAVYSDSPRVQCESCILAPYM